MAVVSNSYKAQLLALAFCWFKQTFFFLFINKPQQQYYISVTWIFK